MSPPPDPAAGARFAAAGDQSLLLEFGREITPEANERMAKLLWLLESEPVPGIRNLHPGYCSLLVKFDALKMDHAELEAILRRRLGRLAALAAPATREVEIPVCYGGEFGRDLEDLAAMHGMTSGQAIELHASVNYSVCFLGFVPGFAYLAGLPQALHTPRLASPRRTIPPGSVGIAGGQTGVYPLATPGGWRLIGRTPLALFDPAGALDGESGGRLSARRMSLLATGDRVRFKPISEEQFQAEYRDRKSGWT